MNNGSRMRRGGNRRRSNKVSSAVSNKRHNRDNYRGIIANAHFDPPRVLATPWNQLVVSWKFIGGTSASNQCFDFFTDLAPAMRAQCGLPNIDIGYRIESLQVWHLAPNGEVNNVVRVRFMSLIEGITACSVSDTIAALEDYGTPVRPASVKFIWPKTHFSNTFPSSSTRIIARATYGPSQQLLLHAKILWKFVGSTNSLFDAPFPDELASFSALSLNDK